MPDYHQIISTIKNFNQLLYCGLNAINSTLNYEIVHALAGYTKHLGTIHKSGTTNKIPIICMVARALLQHGRERLPCRCGGSKY